MTFTEEQIRDSLVAHGNDSLVRYALQRLVKVKVETKRGNRCPCCHEATEKMKPYCSSCGMPLDWSIRS